MCPQQTYIHNRVFERAIKRDMEKGVKRSEIVLRLIATCLLLLAAFLIRTNSQTKLIFDVVEKKATFRSIYIFVFQLYVVCVAAGYSFLQLVRCLFMSKKQPSNLKFSKHLQLASTFLLDQVLVYLVFATNAASTTASMFAVTGNASLEWNKVCNLYTRFCYQVGGYLLVGFVANIVLAVISAISAYSLFRFYSPTRFLRLKSRPSLVG